MPAIAFKSSSSNSTASEETPTHSFFRVYLSARPKEVLSFYPREFVHGRHAWKGSRRPEHINMQRSAEKKQVLVTFVTKDANPIHHLPDGSPSLVRYGPAGGPWPMASVPVSPHRTEACLGVVLPRLPPTAPTTTRAFNPWPLHSAPETLLVYKLAVEWL